MAVKITSVPPKGKSGYTINYRHPVVKDRDGKYGLKIHRGLGTTDPERATYLVKQLQELVDDERWWDYSKKEEAYAQFESVIVDAFYDAMETKIEDKGKYLDVIPLPSKQQGGEYLSLIGPSGAGKTSILRTLLGTKKERFPSAASGRTTTCNMEIITSSSGEYEAVITFMSRHIVEMYVQECIEEALLYGYEGSDPESERDRIEEKLLTHKDLVLRLAYILGDSSLLKQREVDEDEDAEEIEIEEASYEYEQDLDGLKTCVAGFVDRIIELVKSYKENNVDIAADEFNFEDDDSVLALRRDIVDEIRNRFQLLQGGKKLNQQGAWINAWYFRSENKMEFLKKIKMFTSNSKAYWGGLLTPIVDSVRIKGNFNSEGIEPRENLVIYDGEGLGHKTTLTSMPTEMVNRLAMSDAIIAVDNALQPVMENTKMALKTFVEMGLAQKVLIAFTHVDLMNGDNLVSISDKKNHVRIALETFLRDMKNSNTDKVSNNEITSLLDNCFFFSDLDEKKEMSKLTNNNLNRMLKRVYELFETNLSVEDVVLHYDEVTLYNHIKNAIAKYRDNWSEKIGLPVKTSKTEFWSRIKALTRRLGYFGMDHYNYELMPLADLNAQIRSELNVFLNRPLNVEPNVTTEEVKKELINNIKLQINTELAAFIKNTMWQDSQQLKRWQDAYDYRGRYSSYDRSIKIKEIFEYSAPEIGDYSYDMNEYQRHYIQNVIGIVRRGIEKNGSRLEGVKEW